jgi:hypothetical protein
VKIETHLPEQMNYEYVDYLICRNVISQQYFVYRLESSVRLCVNGILHNIYGPAEETTEFKHYYLSGQLNRPIYPYIIKKHRYCGSTLTRMSYKHENNPYAINVVDNKIHTLKLYFGNYDTTTWTGDKTYTNGIFRTTKFYSADVVGWDKITAIEFQRVHRLFCHLFFCR